MIWHLNNTSIRNPGRYLEALRAYEEYGYIDGLFDRGNTEVQKALYNLILDAGLIDSSTRDSDWNGRKWRLGFRELGLIHYKGPDGLEPGTISKSGRAILDASNDAELQDAYFRIIFNLETRKRDLCFRPVPLILNVIKLLKEAGEKDSINQIEFAVTLQDYREDMTPKDYFNEIIKFRKEVKANKGKLRNFYNETYKKVHERNNRRPNIQTISKDYPDVTFRLLKLSGIFRLEGSKLILNPQYLNLLNTLCSDNKTSKSEDEYYQKISNLPAVPIDKDKEVLKSIVTENAQKLNIASPNLEALDNEELRLLRINQEDQILKNTEENFAYEQRNKVTVITKWFHSLISNNGVEEDFEGENIAFRRDERPQYLEWIVWRAFLAINNLSNKPYESRKFPLDSELKPTSHAPSRGPDLLMEFDEFNLVVEVTWTTSSRQVAAESEPVIRHVASIAKESEKSTYCLFLAPEINLNTLNSYRLADEYYFDEKTSVIANIIPLSLEQFIKFFKEIPKAKQESIDKIFIILKESTEIKRELSPIDWKNYINEKFVA